MSLSSPLRMLFTPLPRFSSPSASQVELYAGTHDLYTFEAHRKILNGSTGTLSKLWILKNPTERATRSRLESLQDKKKKCHASLRLVSRCTVLSRVRD
jgi:hypothetical protein